MAVVSCHNFGLRSSALSPVGTVFFTFFLTKCWIYVEEYMIFGFYGTHNLDVAEKVESSCTLGFERILLFFTFMVLSSLISCRVGGRLPLDALLVGAGSKKPQFSSKCPPGRRWKNERSWRINFY